MQKNIIRKSFMQPQTYHRGISVMKYYGLIMITVHCYGRRDPSASMIPWFRIHYAEEEEFWNVSSVKRAAEISRKCAVFWSFIYFFDCGTRFGFYSTDFTHAKNYTHASLLKKALFYPDQLSVTAGRVSGQKTKKSEMMIKQRLFYECPFMKLFWKIREFICLLSLAV